MSSVSFVQDASSKTRWLVERESRGPGDTRNAMERLARRYGLSFGSLWSLRYRIPKNLTVSTYSAICAAHEAECARQARLLHDERTRTTATTWLGRALVGSTEAVGGEDAQTVDGGECR